MGRKRASVGRLTERSHNYLCVCVCLLCALSVCLRPPTGTDLTLKSQQTKSFFKTHTHLHVSIYLPHTHNVRYSKYCTLWPAAHTLTADV